MDIGTKAQKWRRCAGLGPVILATMVVSSMARLYAQTRIPSVFAPYAGPGQLVEVAPGRRINLVCSGDGSPTVILSIGGTGWSLQWFKVAPLIARITRVCSWDRPGNGYSDASPHPLDIEDNEADLERALNGAGVTGPLVLVGHSLGGLESLLFADRHPDRVVGMVLVDPSTPDQDKKLSEAAPKLMAWSRAGDRKAFEPVDRCIAALMDGPRDPAPEACIVLRDGLPASIAKALTPLTEDPAYWATFRTDLDQRARNAKQAINPKRSYGEMPLVVLGSGKLSVPGAPAEAVAEIPALQTEIKNEQQALARLSSRGAYLRVPNSGHAIMIDKPDAVTDAVAHVIEEVHQRNSRH
jgi:pimeloyl-ACP methyl ester carboxylesterase